MKNTLYSRGNPYTVVQTTDSLYSASEGEFVISSGSEVELPTPTQDSVVAVRGEPRTGVDVVPSSGQAQLNTNGISLEYGESAVFVSDGNDWYLRNDVSFYGLDIPDSGLSHDYNALDLSGFSDGSTVSTLTDSAGSNDATGYGTFRQTGINSRQSVELDGTDDNFVANANGSASYTFAAVVEFLSAPSEDETLFKNGANGGDNGLIARVGSSGGVEWIHAGEVIVGEGGSLVQSPTIIVGAHDSSTTNTIVEQDNSEIINTTAAYAAADGDLYIGSDIGGASNANVYVGRYLYYDQYYDAAGRSDIYSGLAYEWGF
jgi:hypothetical protein